MTPGCDFLDLRAVEPRQLAEMIIRKLAALGIIEPPEAGVLCHLRRFDEAITACREAAALYQETNDVGGERNAKSELNVAQRRSSI